MALGGSCHLPMSFLLCRPGGKVSHDRLRLRRANRPVRFSPNQEPEPFGRGLPCQSDQQWPNALRAAGDDPTSTPRLHAASSRTRAAMRAMLGRVSFQSLMIGCLPKCLALLSSQPIAEAHSQLLHTFNTANASRQIGAEETTVGGLICEPAHGTETQVDGARCKLTGFEMRPIAQHHYSVESQARFRTIPVNELIDGVTITPLGVQAGEAI